MARAGGARGTSQRAISSPRAAGPRELLPPHDTYAPGRCGLGTDPVLPLAIELADDAPQPKSAKADAGHRRQSTADLEGSRRETADQRTARDHDSPGLTARRPPGRQRPNRLSARRASLAVGAYTARSRLRHAHPERRVEGGERALEAARRRGRHRSPSAPRGEVDAPRRVRRDAGQLGGVVQTRPRPRARAAARVTCSQREVRVHQLEVEFGRGRLVARPRRGQRKVSAGHPHPCWASGPPPSYSSRQRRRPTAHETIRVLRSVSRCMSPSVYRARRACVGR